MGGRAAAGVFRCWLHVLHAPEPGDVVPAREQEYHHAHERQRERQLPQFHEQIAFFPPSRTRSSFPPPRNVTPPGRPARVTAGHDDGMGIAPDAVASYVDRAVEAMADIVGDLGDDLANTRPGLPGANSPYVILRHCLGVMEFWA